MENPKVSEQRSVASELNSQGFSKVGSDGTTKEVSPSAKLNQKNIEPFSLNPNKFAELFKGKPTFDYSQVVEIAKNLKSLDPSKHSQIESILTSKNSNLSNNALMDIINSINETNVKKDIKTEESESNQSDSDSDDSSLGDMIEKNEEKNLVENVKENLDKLLQRSAMKKKTLKKRWWTPEEVTKNYNSNLLRMNY